jgi:hypothetical protein
MIFVGFTGLLLVHFRSKHSDDAKRFKRIDAMFIYLFGTMLSQGYCFNLNIIFPPNGKLMNENSTGGYYRSGHRLIGFIAGIWCFIGFFFINSYSSILTSRFSAHYQYPEVKSLDDLANKPQYQLATLKGSVWESYLLVFIYSFLLLKKFF